MVNPMKITKITVQKKRKDRYNIFLDRGNGEEYAFSVDEGVLIEWQLKKGMFLTQEQEEEIKASDFKKDALNKGLQYLAHGMKTEYQIKDYLFQKEFPEDAINDAVEKIRSFGYINDKEFADAFVRTKMNTSDKGPAIIKEELKNKGVQLSVADLALQQYSEDKQLAQAIRIIEKKGKRKKNESASLLKKRLTEGLLRKGYSLSIIDTALKEADLSHNEEDEWLALCSQGEKVRRKLNKKYEGSTFRVKLKENLYRKGFSLSLIDQYIKNTEEEK